MKRSRVYLCAFFCWFTKVQDAPLGANRRDFVPEVPAESERSLYEFRRSVFKKTCDRFFWLVNMEFIRVGKLINTHGLDGDLVMQLTTDSPEIFDEMQYMMLAKDGDVKASLKIEYMQDYKGNFLVGLAGVTDIDTALKYKGMDVVIPEDMLPESGGDIYWRDLEGSRVFDSEGDFIGTLVDYMEAGGTDVFRIKGAHGYYLISNNSDHVLEINAQEKKLVVSRSGLVSEEI